MKCTILVSFVLLNKVISIIFFYLKDTPAFLQHSVRFTTKYIYFFSQHFYFDLKLPKINIFKKKRKIVLEYSDFSTPLPLYMIQPPCHQATTIHPFNFLHRLSPPNLLSIISSSPNESLYIQMPGDRGVKRGKIWEKVGLCMYRSMCMWGQRLAKLGSRRMSRDGAWKDSTYVRKSNSIYI